MEPGIQKSVRIPITPQTCGPSHEYRRHNQAEPQAGAEQEMQQGDVSCSRVEWHCAWHEEWLAASKNFLKKEKEFTRQRDEISQLRRELPWEKVEKKYVFEGPNGTETLADLFEGRGQLIAYHFMFGPGWKEGCPSCSFLADAFDAIHPHITQRDTTFVVVSRATLPEIDAFKKRMSTHARPRIQSM